MPRFIPAAPHSEFVRTRKYCCLRGRLGTQGLTVNFDRCATRQRLKLNQASLLDTAVLAIELIPKNNRNKNNYKQNDRQCHEGRDEDTSCKLFSF
ncbi:hypothetical protein D9M69_571060 [compost metagenome]